MSSASLLRENGKISEDIILLCDEMYLQKQAQYHGGKYVGEDEDGNNYKGIFVLMIVGLKDSLPYVVKSCPEVTINGEKGNLGHYWKVSRVSFFFSRIFL